MRALLLVWSACLLLVAPATAQRTAPRPSLPLDRSAMTPSYTVHPTSHPRSGRSFTAYIQGSGQFGEDLVRRKLESEGWTWIDAKTGGNRGLDGVALRYDADGRVADLRFVEVKTHYGGKPRLSQTAHGRQLSRQWLARQLKLLRNSGDERKVATALMISRALKQLGSNALASRGWLYSVDTKTGVIVAQPRVGSSELLSIRRAALAAALRGPGAKSRVHATRDLLRGLRGFHSHKHYAALSKSGRANWRMPSRDTLRRAPQMSRLLSGRTTRLATRALARSAGPLGVGMSIFTTGVLVEGYVSGSVTQRTLIREASGAAGGTLAGMGTGMALGSVAGPPGWVVGSLVGGMLGYLAGDVAVDTYFATADAETRRNTLDWIRDSPLSQARAEMAIYDN